MSYKDRTVAVVIPAHNEAAFIGSVIRTLPSYVDTIIVVDDASTDGTAEVARRTEDRRVHVIILDRNSGVGGAMVAGYRLAMEVGSDIVVKMDGDGQMSPDDLPGLLDAMAEGQFVYAKGNRFLMGSPREDMPRSRFVGNMVLTFLTKLASGYWHIFDPQNGYTAISSAALELLDLEMVHKGYFFENDILVQLNLHGFRVKDVPMRACYGNEASGINPVQISVSFPRLLLQRFLYRVYRKYMLRDFSPVALFLLTGCALFLWGVLFGVFLWVRGKMAGVAAPTGTIMLAIVPLFIGFQLLLQGIVLDIQETPK